MQVSIVPMTSEEEAKGKAYVHCTAWKEAYRGLLNQNYLNARVFRPKTFNSEAPSAQLGRGRRSKYCGSQSHSIVGSRMP